LRQLRARQHGLKDEPLGHEPVEWRQSRDGQAPAEEKKGRLRHGMDQAAELFDVALSRCGQDGARAEEQQALEQRMVERM
jgi:hypothetical protein